MKKHILAIITLFTLSGLNVHAQNSTVIRNYIEQFKEIAMEEMIRTGVPASITLAQGIHETGAGTSMLVQKSNNHFGIKCKTEWTGEKVYHDDDARGECFRKYSDPLESYKDHSDFLKYRPHYASLFKLDPLDYKGWAHGLKKAGYATNPKYPQILIRLIEDYNLQDYTLLALNGKKPTENDVVWVSQPNAENSEDAQLAKVERKDIKTLYPSGVFRINDTKVMVVVKGTSFLKIAGEQGISLAKLFEFNEMQESDIAEEDMLIYLQRKRKTSHNEFHEVLPGETLHEIAQSEGIRLESLMEYNSLKPGDEPKEGEKLSLQRQSGATPLLAILKGDTPKPQSAPISKEAPVYFVHTVQSRETAYSISKKYGVTVEDILAWNNLNTADLRIGQELRIQKN